MDALLCTKSRSSSGKEKRSFSWFLPLWRTWGGWGWSRWFLREVVITIFEHHLGLGVRIALGEKGCFGKKGKVFPGINGNPCCFCYLLFVFLLAGDGSALVNSSQSHWMLCCGEAVWFMACNFQTEQFIRFLNLFSPYFLLTQSSVFPIAIVKISYLPKAVNISVILLCYWRPCFSLPAVAGSFMIQLRNFSYKEPFSIIKILRG